jgi:hypothetical protein
LWGFAVGEIESIPAWPKHIQLAGGSAYGLESPDMLKIRLALNMDGGRLDRYDYASLLCLFGFILCFGYLGYALITGPRREVEEELLMCGAAVLGMMVFGIGGDAVEYAALQADEAREATPYRSRRATLRQESKFASRVGIVSGLLTIVVALATILGWVPWDSILQWLR